MHNATVPALPQAGAPKSATGAPAAKADSSGLAVVPNTMVTLHRVGTDAKAPLDSARTTANGNYDFKYKTSGAADAVYFTSVTWGGIAYFTAPFRTALVRGTDAEITVFDTTTTRERIDATRRGHAERKHAHARVAVAVARGHRLGWRAIAPVDGAVGEFAIRDLDDTRLARREQRIDDANALSAPRE